jgi:hypothetical protein
MQPASWSVANQFASTDIRESRIDGWLRTHADSVALIAVGIGLLLRVRAASGTFLNPDETLHFSLANQTSFLSAYHASLTLAHPPLLVLLLYFWRVLGTSEFVLRLPSVIAGTAFCWIFYKWLKDLLGSTAGLAGVIFMVLLPPIVALTSEVRQYSLLLLFVSCAALLLERALAKNSAWVMLCSFVCLWLAMLSHYSALLFAATYGAYSALRLLRQRPARSVITAWIAGQLSALALFLFLYRVQLSKLKDSTLAEQAISEWLRRSYFHPGVDNLLAFVLGRSFAVFQFIFGQLVVGDIAALLFVAGVVFLIRTKQQPDRSRPSPQQVAFFLVFPFVVNCALAVAGRYPYGGTRHCVFLATFAIAGISFFLDVITRQRPSFAIGLTVLILTICYVFGFHHQPYMTREDQSRSQMDHAMEFIRGQVPSGDPIFVDYQGNLMLSHYLCGQRPTVIGISDFQMFQCAGHEIISTPPRMWMLTSQTFPKYWEEVVAKYGLRAGTGVWVVQAGWGAGIAPDLQRKRNDLAPRESESFGRNINMFKLVVGQPASSAPQ